MAKPIVGVLLDGERTFHAAGVYGDYDTLCGIDANDPAIGHTGPVDVPRGQTITCATCRQIWQRVRELNLNIGDFDAAKKTKEAAAPARAAAAADRTHAPRPAAPTPRAPHAAGGEGPGVGGGRGIINTHDQLRAAGGGVAITVSMGGIRDTYVQGWCVYKLNAAGKKVDTDAQAAWYDYGCKIIRMLPRHQLGTELTFKQRKDESLARAQAWVAQELGIAGPWKRNASGDFVLADVQERFPIRRKK